MSRHIAASLAAVAMSAGLFAAPAFSADNLRHTVAHQVAKIGLDKALVANASQGQLAQMELVLNNDEDARSIKQAQIKLIAAQ